ncbi:MAG: deoxyguanosinetriphosphate triphosphohydrolase [Deltaproteobacteria bacterium]|nr:deoxyguanosinetriphosphate triphosphohydrolase [Deltaproteobacteria bacterium]
MILLRLEIEKRERDALAPYATRAAETRGRLVPEPECELRTAFQRDRDRITHSKAFRRLKHKTQVFLAPTGDHYRTRLTHTLEVAQIARTISRTLRLNEDLTEAISLGHDLGHTPFGHAGEEVLNEIFPGGFSHHQQGLRVIDCLEKNGKGLNLTAEVRDGIIKHSKGKSAIISPNPEDMAYTVEGRVVRIADIIAYIAHDVEDALRGGVIEESDIPSDCVKTLGDRTSARINTMVLNLVRNTRINGEDIELGFSPEVEAAMIGLRDFLYDHVYDVNRVHEDFIRSAKVVRELYEVFMQEKALLLKELGSWPEDEVQRAREVCDFIAGMTDRYALDLYQRIFLPKPWAVF